MPPQDTARMENATDREEWVTKARTRTASNTEYLVAIISGSVKAVARRQAGFMDLPRELRDEVYKNAIVSCFAIDLYDPFFLDRLDERRGLRQQGTDRDTKLHKLRLPRGISSLMLTSKLVKEEALEIFLPYNTFTLLSYGDFWQETWTSKDYAKVVPLWRSTFGDRLRHMRSFRFVMNGDREYWETDCDYQWRDGEVEVTRAEENGSRGRWRL